MDILKQLASMYAEHLRNTKQADQDSLEQTKDRIRMGTNPDLQGPRLAGATEAEKAQAEYASGMMMPNIGAVTKGKKVAQTANEAAKQKIKEQLKLDDPGNDSVRNLVKRFMDEKEITYVPHAKVDVDPKRGSRIAHAFEQMEHNPNDPEVQKAYQALIDETVEQFKLLQKNGLKVSKIQQGQANPYASGSKAVFEDIKNNNHLWYYPTEQGFGSGAITDHPLLVKKVKLGDEEVPANDIFRIVHDYFGHAKEGVGFGAKGEENAFQIHRRMYSPDARKALATETRGQNSWVNFGPHGEANRAAPAMTKYAEQKAGLLPDWATKEGVPGISYAGDTLVANKAQELTGKGVEVLTDRVGNPIARFRDGNMIGLVDDMPPGNSEPTLVPLVSNIIKGKK